MAAIIKKEDLHKINFVKFPNKLIYDEKYKGIKAEGKILYSILLDLITLSIENGWINKAGEPYVKLSREKIKKLLNIKGSEKMAAVVAELKSYGLISERKTGFTSCNEIYIYNIEEDSKCSIDEDYEGFREEILDEKEFITKGNEKDKDEDEESEKDKEKRKFSIEDLEAIEVKEILKGEVMEDRKSKVQSFENQKYIKNNYIKNNLNKDNIKDDDESFKIEVKENLEKKQNEYFKIEGKIKGDLKELSEKINLLKELYEDIEITDAQARAILKAAKENVYVADMAYLKIKDKIGSIENIVGYLIVVIKSLM